jgi:hypothetical protein
MGGRYRCFRPPFAAHSGGATELRPAPPHSLDDAAHSLANRVLPANATGHPASPFLRPSGAGPEPAMNRSGKPVCEHCRALAGPSVIIAMVPVMAIS